MAADTGRSVVVTMDGDDLKDELREKGITFNGELVDVTTDGDEGWTTTLDEIFNVQNVSVTLGGVLKAGILPEMAFSGKQKSGVITVGTLFTLTGTWQFQPGFEIGAPHNGERTFSGTVQSVGSVTKAPVT